jgi:hypothetical protein
MEQPAILSGRSKRLQRSRRLRQALAPHRSPQEGAEQDEGVYIEYNDEIHGGYQKIRRCTLARRLFSVDLTQPFRKLPDVDGFDVELDIKDADYAQVCMGLQRIFRDQLQVLIIVA